MPGVGNTAPLHYRNDTIAVVTSLGLGFAYPQCYLFFPKLVWPHLSNIGRIIAIRE